MEDREAIERIKYEVKHGLYEGTDIDLIHIQNRYADLRQNNKMFTIMACIACVCCAAAIVGMLIVVLMTL